MASILGNLGSASIPKREASLIKKEGYDNSGNVTVEIDALGNRTTQVYDNAGRLSATVDAQNNRTTFYYDAVGRGIATMDALGRLTTTVYDAAGRVSANVDARGYRTTFSYDAAGRRTMIQDARGNYTTFVYDDTGRLSALVDQFAYRTTYAYDAASRQTSITNALGKITTNVYDDGGRVTATVNSLGYRTTMTYNANGRMTCMEDANNKRTTYSYDALGRQVDVTDANGNITTNVYDAVSQRIAMIDPRNNRVTYTYDSRGMQTAMTDQLGRITTYSYDVLGRQQTQLDAKGQTITFVYDAANRMTRKEYSDGTRATFSYDAISNRLTMEDGTGVTTFSYNAAHMLEVVTYPAGKTITYSFNEMGSRTAMVDPDGGITTYNYDAANRISWLLNPFSEYTTFAYDSLGQRITQQNGNGTWVSYTYDDAGRLTDQVHLKSDNSIFDSWSNEHDFVGNLIATTETNGDIITYTYDSAYQLTREYHVSAHPYDIIYTYDAAGNRLTKVDSGATTTYAYDVANQLETEETTSGITTFTFDANGNTFVENAGGDLTTYTWSIDNMCLGIALPNATLNTFVYDADLTRRQEEDSAGVAKFINDMENVLLETNSGGTTQAAYTLEPQQYGNLLSQRRSSASHFHHFDVIGSTDSVTNSAETKEVHYQSKAFGPTEVLSGSFTANRYMWNARVGYRWEPDTGQYDVRRRKYATFRGSWLSPDPIKIITSLYSYMENAPTYSNDPSGLARARGGSLGHCWELEQRVRKALAMPGGPGSAACKAANAALYDFIHQCADYRREDRWTSWGLIAAYLNKCKKRCRPRPGEGYDCKKTAATGRTAYCICARPKPCEVLVDCEIEFSLSDMYVPICYCYYEKETGLGTIRRWELGKVEYTEPIDISCALETAKCLNDAMNDCQSVPPFYYWECVAVMAAVHCRWES